MKPNNFFHSMHTATETSLVYGTKNSRIYAIPAYHAQALSRTGFITHRRYHCLDRCPNTLVEQTTNRKSIKLNRS
jgi:hypothetical protein